MSSLGLVDANCREAILWQYEQAERLIGLVNVIQAGYDKLNTDFWQNWYRDVFNIDTANDFGLSVWARILNLPLAHKIGAGEPKDSWGLSEERLNFQKGANFARGTGENLQLTTDQIRLIVRTRYFALTHRPTLKNINEHLDRYYSKGKDKVYVVDPMDMTFLIYTFTFQIDNALHYLLENLDILPRPMGVGVRVNIISEPSFGVGPERIAFDQGVGFGDIEGF